MGRDKVGCFRKCYFGIPRNKEFCTELVLFRVIPRNFLLFYSAEFRGTPNRFVYTEFRIPSNLATAFCIMQPGVKSKNFGRLPWPLKGQSGKKNHIWGTYYLLPTKVFLIFLWNKIKRTGEEMSWNSFYSGRRKKNKVMRNFVTPKVTKFREIPRNSTNSVIRNSA